MKANKIPLVPSKGNCHSNCILAAIILFLFALAGVVRAQITNIIYQDDFGWLGRLGGSTPSQVDTANATWYAWPQLITDGFEISVTNQAVGQSKA